MTKYILISALLLCTFSLSCIDAGARSYQLSSRTISEFKKFKEIQADIESTKKLATILVSIKPFLIILNKPTSGQVTWDIGNFTRENWIEMKTGLDGLSENHRQDLKLFAELEAVKQHKSRDDFLFWRTLARQFIRKPTDVDISGTWKKRITAEHKGPVPSLRFEKKGDGYNGFFVISIDGSEIKRPLTEINIKRNSASFAMPTGSNRITYLLTMSDNARVLTGRVSTKSDSASIVFEKQ